jgi:serine/threonine-protein kinase HipA
MVASQLVVEGDDEELALTLNGKKKKLKTNDFVVAMKSSGISEKSISNIFTKFEKALPLWHNFIEISFLPKAVKTAYKKLIDAKHKQLQFN